MEDNHRYFYPPEDPADYRFDVGNEHELVADVDDQTLIKLVKFLKVVDSCQTCSTKCSYTFRSFFVCGKEQESRKKNMSSPCKKNSPS